MMHAGVAAGHPATTDAAIRVLRDGGSAADAAVAGVLASCVAESIFTGLAGGGFAIHYDAAARRTTSLDFFCAVPGLDGTVADPMVPIDVAYGQVPVPYLIGGASAAVPGVPAGLAEVHRRWGVLPWPDLVAPAAALARSGITMPEAHTEALKAVAPALVLAEGASVYAPNGQHVDGGDVLFLPGIDKALSALAVEGAEVFYTGWIGQLITESVRRNGGALGQEDLAAYRVRETPIRRSRLAGRTVLGRQDLNDLLGTIRALPRNLPALSRAERTRHLVRAIVSHGPEAHGETTNISAVDAAGNACVITTSLGIGSGVWLPGLSVHVNSMLGEVELGTGVRPPGSRLSSMMCPLVVLDADGALELAAGAAGASRIRSALIQTLLGILVEGRRPADAVAASRFHVVAVADGRPVVHAEPGYPPDGLDGLAAAGFPVRVWDHRSVYFGGVSAVGTTGAGADPRRGGVGLTLVDVLPRTATTPRSRVRRSG
jgi:gamma-glutamyltranspeptidase/glutathione hydrolase